MPGNVRTPRALAVGVCQKLDLPWSLYGKETVVLCKVSDGLELAKLLAVGIINQHFAKALMIDIPLSFPLPKFEPTQNSSQ